MEKWKFVGVSGRIEEFKVARNLDSKYDGSCVVARYKRLLLVEIDAWHLVKYSSIDVPSVGRSADMAIHN